MAPQQHRQSEAEVLRVADLPLRRELVVRSVQTDDRAALQALYDELDAESRYRRFFSMYHPPASFFERLISVDERGGVGLVACTRTRGSTTEAMVAEAHYELLANGDGEFAITVAHAWRGWLGPYLLDTLLEAAATRGVPNLEAYILGTNSPMLALVRSRGYVVLPDDDFTTLHISLATGPGGPRWPAHRTGFRLLVEGLGAHSAVSEAAAAAGLEVVQCSGPLRRGRRCPIVGGGQCPLAAGADAIVLADPDEQSEWALIRERHEELAHRPPVWVTCHRGRVPLRPNETALVASGGELIDFFRRQRPAEQ